MIAKIMAALLCLLIVDLKTAYAKEKTPAEIAGDLVRHVKIGTPITLKAYVEKLHAFEVMVNTEPAVGPNYAEPEELSKAIEFDSDAQAMIKKKEQMIGAVYQLKKPLLLLTENEVLRRRAKK